MLIFQEWKTNNKWKKSKKKEDEEYAYDNNNEEYSYDEEIEYDQDTYQEELDGLLEDIERNPNFHKQKDKENYEDAEE